MDKGIRIILGLAIALLYPLLVYFAVVTIIPKSEAAQRPSYPTCERYTSYSGRLDRSCQREYDEYNDKLRSYNDAEVEDRKANDQTRAFLALGLSVVTVVGVIALRDVKELTAGITAGALVVMVTAVTTLLVSYDNNENVWINVVVIAVFIGLTALLYTGDNKLFIRASSGTKPKSEAPQSE